MRPPRAPGYSTACSCFTGWCRLRRIAAAETTTRETTATEGARGPIQTFYQYLQQGLGGRAGFGLLRETADRGFKTAQSALDAVPKVWY